MIKKIIEISRAHTRLSIKNGQLIIRQESRERSIPCEDIGVLLVDHSGVTYTHSVFTELLRYNCAVVLCGRDHHPSGMLMPIESNGLQSERFRNQASAKEPLKKQLWKQVVVAKIRHQAKNIGQGCDTYDWLKALSKRVRSGDPDNIEAQASKRYWRAFIGFADFRRDREGRYPNNLLNYGYMALRAAVARSICCAGLIPTLAIHHRNRYNAFCLADDMMEPFRGYVESKVKHICENHTPGDNLNQYIKSVLLEVLYEDVEIAGFKGPLMVGLHRTMASLQRCFAGEQKRLELPKL